MIDRHGTELYLAANWHTMQKPMRETIMANLPDVVAKLGLRIDDPFEPSMPFDEFDSEHDREAIGQYE